MAGIVTLLAVAEALGEMKRNGNLRSTENAIMFMFFQGESWDYIGSSRMVYDVINGKFPYQLDTTKEQPPILNLSDVMSVIELSQVGIQKDIDDPTYYIHQNNFNNVVPLLNEYSLKNNISIRGSSSGTNQLPPGSAHMFLRENQSIPVAMVTDYDQHYNNRFFGSRFDVLENLIGLDKELNKTSPLVIQLTNLATTVAQSLLNMSIADTTNDSDSLQADPDVVYSLLHCFLVNANCSFFRSRLSPQQGRALPSRPIYRYVSVSRSVSDVTSIVYSLMANFTGEVNTSISECSDCNTPENTQTFYNTPISGNETYNDDGTDCLCVKSYTHFHDAVSPAFDLKDYTSTYYSTWTESQWTSTGVRIYVISYVGLEIGLLFVGIFISVVVFFVSCQCTRRGRLIFAVTASRTAEANNN
jgi:nicastrin